MDFRNDFLQSSAIYLNSGTLSRSPKSVVEAQHRYINEYENNPAASLFGSWEKLWGVQAQVAGYFHAAPEDFYLRPNVTFAMNDFIMAVDMPAGGEILVSDLEYGAIVNICELRCRKDGRTLRSLRLPVEGADRPRTAQEWCDYIVSELRHDTRMLMLSHVMTGNGLVLPIKEIAAETRKRGVLFAVDGAHGPGALHIDFRELEDVDFYGGNLHKWMMGPKGTGFGWVPKRMQKDVRPIAGSWTVFETPAYFQKFGGGDRFAAQMLNSSTVQFSPYFALKETIDYWRDKTEVAIQTRVRELQRHLMAKMNEVLDWPTLSPVDHDQRGPLVAYRMPEKLRALGYHVMFRLSAEEQVQVATPMIHNEFVMRLAPSIYNSEEEIDRAIAIIRRFAEKVGQ